MIFYYDSLHTLICVLSINTKVLIFKIALNFSLKYLLHQKIIALRKMYNYYKYYYFTRLSGSVLHIFIIIVCTFKYFNTKLKTPEVHNSRIRDVLYYSLLFSFIFVVATQFLFLFIVYNFFLRASFQFFINYHTLMSTQIRWFWILIYL